ncbi:hypothetical protein CJE0045 [Campylobacter jejuni RM1221]|nr:hypothetical protein CJE0045 [Campylobacter jejuni RM1221]
MILVCAAVIWGRVLFILKFPIYFSIRLAFL